MATLLWTTFYMGALVLAASFCLHYTAYRKGIYVQGDDDVSESWGKGWGGKDDDEDDGPATRNPLLKHWLDFGGGYYGTVAFVELLLIEYQQVRAFFADWQGLTRFIDSLGIDWLVSFFVEQIQNFVAAIIWPTDYLSNFTIVQCAIFVGVTYVLFELSKTLARRHFDKRHRESKRESYTG